MLAVVGAIAITCVALYFGYISGLYMLFSFLGFDEVNIPFGIICLVVFAAICLGWWLLVGTHIHVSMS